MMQCIGRSLRRIQGGSVCAWRKGLCKYWKENLVEASFTINQEHEFHERKSFVQFLIRKVYKTHRYPFLFSVLFILKNGVFIRLRL